MSNDLNGRPLLPLFHECMVMYVKTSLGNADQMTDKLMAEAITIVADLYEKEKREKRGQIYFIRPLFYRP